MDCTLTDDLRRLRDAVFALCAKFGDAYWLAHDRSGEFPVEFHRAIADAGWLGIAMPEAFGGSGLGIREAAVMMQAIAESGAAMSGASAVHMNIFGLQPVVVLGTESQKARMLPPLIRGDERACFAVTEPDAGLNTTRLRTRADRCEGGYRINGSKIWISTAQVAERVLLLARTTPLESVTRKTEGLSLFYTTLDRSQVEVRKIDKMGRHAVDSNVLFFNDMFVPEEDRIGPEGSGFRSILHGMNPERILMGAEAVGIGRAAVRRAVAYAKERIVFDRPIGQNQAIAHPLARAWMHLEAANLMVMQAAALYDAGSECGVQANAAKYLAAQAGFEACEQAVLTLGGMGYSAEFHVERYLRESFIPRIAPVSEHMILNFVAEKELGLPKSY
ncbi:MAG: acyl-CoA dehydrogenase family protein [Burkholderiales bacterium]